MNTDKDLLIKVLKELKETKKEIAAIKRRILSEPQWVSASDVAKERGLQTQSVIKQLGHVSFEPEVDYKLIGNKMYVAKNVIYRIKRMRK